MSSDSETPAVPPAPATSSSVNQPVSVIPQSPTNEPRTSTIRDALLWSTALVPFLALALLPRRSHLRSLNSSLTALSRSQQKHSRLLSELHQQQLTWQDDAIRELRDKLADNTVVLGKLRTFVGEEFRRRDEGLKGLESVVRQWETESERRKVLDRAAVQTLEEARRQLVASRRTSDLLTNRLSVSMADIAAFMERIDIEHGLSPEESDAIERLRSIALDLEAPSSSESTQAGKTESKEREGNQDPQSRSQITI